MSSDWSDYRLSDYWLHCLKLQPGSIGQESLQPISAFDIIAIYYSPESGDYGLENSE